MKKIDIAKLSSFFRKEANVAAAILFGSAKDGMIREGGDLDIAVLFKQQLTPDESLKFIGKIMKITDFENIDFIELNKANTILAFEAIKGRYLCKNDPDKTAEFCSLTSREYEDVMAQLEYQKKLPKAV